MKTILSLLLSFFWITLSAQIINPKLPGTDHLSKSEFIPEYSFPVLDHKALLMEDEVEMKDKSIPLRFAMPFDVSIDIKEDAFLFVDDNGINNYLLKLNVEGALAVGLIFEKFIIPEHSELFVFNEELSSINGAITSVNNNPRKRMQVSPVKGNQIYILYKEPTNASFQGELIIETVTHVYRDLYKRDKNFGDSGSCNVNVVCEEGSGWEDEIRSIVMIINENGLRLCSGAMINNTSLDCTPYLLSAEHCLPSDISDVGVWSFIFNYISDQCDPSENGLLGNSVFGSELIASSTVTDFALLELDQTPPSSYNVYFSGWSRSQFAPNSSVCIHHPSGDVMKISTDDDPPVLDNYFGETVNNYWRVVDWDSGTTEGGSSGAPLFNPSGKIIGQLRGGQAACNNDLSDYYGAFHLSWDVGSSADERLKDWLDPTNLDPSSLNGTDLCALSIDEQENEMPFSIYPNPASSELTLRSNASLFINEIRIVDASGRYVKQLSLEYYLQSELKINIDDLAKGVYQLQIINEKEAYSILFLKD
jgi:hypothetical protein